MRRIVVVVGWGMLGAVIAAALIGGAFAVAGTRLTQPASAVRVVGGPPLRSNPTDRHETASTPDDDGGGPTSEPSAEADPTPVTTSVVRAPTVPISPPSEDGGAERGDD